MRPWRVCVALAALVLGLAGASRGQTVLDFDETLDRDRPEAWAMAWFGSLTILTRLGEPADLAPGEGMVALEGGWVPSLSEEERRVGFDGTKVEDLNRTAVVGRIRGAVGIPGGVVVSGAWMPPVAIDGIEANVLSLGLGRSFPLTGRWSLGGRLSLSAGEMEGDITCDRGAVAAGSDPEANPFDCLEPSRDTMEIRVGTVELTLEWTGRRDLWSAYGGLLGSYFDNELQVRARYGTVVDRTRLLSELPTVALTLGIGRQAPTGWDWAAEVFYTPLEVERASGRETDALLHARLRVGTRIGSRP